MPTSFANNFRELDIVGTEGYDRLVTRLKDGKKLYDAFSEFARNRAKIENDYGNNLMKLAQYADAGNDETGTLKQSWESVKKETEQIGQIHLELSKHLTELSERCGRYREQQKTERTKVDDAIRKDQKEKKASHDAMQKAKRLYEQRCREYDSAKDAFDSKSTYTPKEEEKLKRTMMKNKTASENADSSYQSSVKVLDDLRQQYETKIEDASNKYQRLEEQRITTLRNEMWLYTNFGSTQALNVDEKYENCRLTLEKCDVKFDIQVFVREKQTGFRHPFPIKYVNFYHSTPETVDWNTNIEKKESPGLSDKSSSHPNLLNDNINPNHLSYMGQHHMLSSSNPNLPSQHNLSQSDKNVIVNEMYASVPHNLSSSKRARAVFAYQAQSEQELSLSPGDMIEILKFVDETWAIGNLNGRHGAFPLTFVDVL